MAAILRFPGWKRGSIDLVLQEMTAVMGVVVAKRSGRCCTRCIGRGEAYGNPVPVIVNAWQGRIY